MCIRKIASEIKTVLALGSISYGFAIRKQMDKEHEDIKDKGPIQEGD